MKLCFAPQMGRNEAAVVRSARPKGKKCRHLMGSGLAFTHLIHTQNAISIKNLTKCLNARSDPHNEGVGRFYE